MKQNHENSTKDKNMKKGKVKWYDQSKGFGFIESDNGDDIFVHQTGLVNEFVGLEQDERVEYDEKQGDKGLVAYNVKSI
jgi:CspA family cold shock protein